MGGNLIGFIPNAILPQVTAAPRAAVNPAVASPFEATEVDIVGNSVNLFNLINTLGNPTAPFVSPSTAFPAAQPTGIQLPIDLSPLQRAQNQFNPLAGVSPAEINQLAAIQRISTAPIGGATPAFTGANFSGINPQFNTFASAAPFGNGFNTGFGQQFTDPALVNQLMVLWQQLMMNLGGFNLEGMLGTGLNTGFTPVQTATVANTATNPAPAPQTTGNNENNTAKATNNNNNAKKTKTDDTETNTQKQTATKNTANEEGTKKSTPKATGDAGTTESSPTKDDKPTKAADKTPDTVSSTDVQPMKFMLTSEELVRRRDLTRDVLKASSLSADQTQKDIFTAWGWLDKEGLMAVKPGNQSKEITLDADTLKVMKQSAKAALKKAGISDEAEQETLSSKVLDANTQRPGKEAKATAKAEEAVKAAAKPEKKADTPADPPAKEEPKKATPAAE